MLLAPATLRPPPSSPSSPSPVALAAILRRRRIPISIPSRWRAPSILNSADPTSAVASVLMEKEEHVELLPAIDDEHGGVIVEIDKTMEPQAFSSSLRASLLYWREKGTRGVWIKLPINLANLVQHAVEEGFWYHHAEENYIMLVYWIPATKHTLPANATHRVGIGALVVNDKRQVLVVQEKNGWLRGKGIWKFPTGVVEQGEDIHEGAVREVKEETGVDTEFIEVLAFRQTHKAFFDKSDLFFLCMLRPLSFNISIQESEIEAAQWITLEEYGAQSFVQKHELLRYMLAIGLAKLDEQYEGFTPMPFKSAFNDRESTVYLNRKDMNRLQPL